MSKYTMCVFFNDIYLSKFKDISEEKLLHELYILGNKVILQGIKLGQKIPQQIKLYKGLLEQMATRRKENKGIWKNNHRLIVSSIGALLKLNQYREDELICVLKTKLK